MAGLTSSDLKTGIFAGVYEGRKVLVTGNTGFKGAWLSLWLKRLGANVIGYSLDSPTTPSLFEEARVGDFTTQIAGDVRDRQALFQAIQEHRPEVVFHLAAQPLVRLSYQEPAETFNTNIMGTVNLLEAVRLNDSVRVCLVVTSDKCYENREWHYAYRENDPMGGFDPYSSSKGCAELVTATYRNSFFPPDRIAEHGVAIASVRAGNVIGGGDWADDRIVPDCIRALTRQQQVEVRNPRAVRPWQHVLEPLSGYLWLAAVLLRDPAPRFLDGWNFGPRSASNLSVQAIVARIVEIWGGGSWTNAVVNDQFHEASFLKLDITKAANLLSWEPTYDADRTLDEVVAWYAARHRDPSFDAREFSWQQITAFEKCAANANIPWAINSGR